MIAMAEFAALVDLDSASCLHWLLAIGLTLFILDIFFCTEILSWGALILFAVWGAWMLDLPLQWSAFSFLLFLGIGFAFYYALWAKAIRPIILKTMLSNAPKDADEAMVGSHGTVCGKGENLCVRCGDELWPIHADDRKGLEAGAQVSITALEHGFVRVSRLGDAAK